MLILFGLALYGLLSSVFKKGWKLSNIFADGGSLPLLRLFMVFNIIYVTAVSNLLEIKEGCFYRMPIDPLLFIGAALAVQIWLDKRRVKN